MHRGLRLTKASDHAMPQAWAQGTKVLISGWVIREYGMPCSHALGAMISSLGWAIMQCHTIVFILIQPRFFLFVPRACIWAHGVASLLELRLRHRWVAFTLDKCYGTSWVHLNRAWYVCQSSDLDAHAYHGQKCTGHHKISYCFCLTSD